ncbi:MAG: S-layer homology domain-containing protein [Peptoniphilaceae bacterium]
MNPDPVNPDPVNPENQNDKLRIIRLSKDLRSITVKLPKNATPGDILVVYKNTTVPIMFSSIDNSSSKIGTITLKQKNIDAKYVNISLEETLKNGDNISVKLISAGNVEKDSVDIIIVATDTQPTPEPIPNPNPGYILVPNNNSSGIKVDINKPVSPSKTNTINETSIKFTDMIGHWAKKAVEYGVNKGYLFGIGNGLFEPDRGISRGEFVTILGRIQNIDKNSYENGNFIDINGDEFYSSYVNWASRKGIVKGIGNKKFNPNGILTREEMAVIMARYIEVCDIKLTNKGAKKFVDNRSISNWAIDSVKKMSEFGIINGDKKGHFNPKEKFTRGQVAQVLYNIDKQ